MTYTHNDIKIFCPANMIEERLEADIKKRFKIAGLPSDIKEMVKEKSVEVGMALMQQDVTKRAVVYGKEIFREVDHSKAIDERLSSALKGVELISQSADLQKMLEENAKMLFNKKQALADAGFTDNEAFQLIMAEVSAKKSK
jgi:hypothetical protein